MKQLSIFKCKFYKVLCSIICIALASCNEIAQGESEQALNAGYESLTISKDTSKHGIYDPSIEYDNKGIGWMAYSSISMPGIQTRLAKTTDQGKTWIDVKAVNTSNKAVLNVNGKKVKGVWKNEVSTLVYCPDDPGREWKLFWHRYFSYKKRDWITYGWIAYKYASNPAGKWSKEIALFGGKDSPKKPYSAKINLSNLHPDLSHYFGYTEPGALYKDGVLYLSIEGAASPTGVGNWKARKTLLLASYDNAKSWKFLGVLTDTDDAKYLGYTILTASSMFEENGKQYLMITPTGSLSRASKVPEGIYIFEFEDITRAKLKRDKNNRLLVRNYIKLSTVKGVTSGGHGDYHSQNKYSGVVMGQVMKPKMFSKNGPKPFQIVITREKPLTSK